MTRNQLRKAVTTRMRLRGLTARGLIRSLGLSEGNANNLGQFLSGEEPPRPVLLAALGYRRRMVERYERARKSLRSNAK